MGRESRRRLLYAAGGAPPAAPPRPLGPGQVPPLDVSAVRRLRGPLSVSVARPSAARPWAPPLEEGGGAETDVIDGAIERALRCRGNLWSAIGAERDASPAEMRAAIRAARRATHPDRAQPEWRRRATEASAIVAQAGEVLGDAHRRRLYDLAGGNLAEYEAAELEGQRAEQQREQQRADEAAAVAVAAAAWPA